MSNMGIALLLSIGVSAWVYSKAMRYTGGEKKTAIIATIFCGLFVLFVSWLTLSTFFN